jgi:hypothetical protein
VAPKSCTFVLTSLSNLELFKVEGMGSRFHAVGAFSPRPGYKGSLACCSAIASTGQPPSPRLALTGKNYRSPDTFSAGTNAGLEVETLPRPGLETFVLSPPASQLGR